MGDINITSHGQQGGVTAQNVTQSTETPPVERLRDSGWVRWGTIAAIVAVVVAVITLYLTQF
jgi:hypothetical protein